MRKFLLTWYGITDLRASLGFENSDGPISSALEAETYSDAVILCYTRVDIDTSKNIDNQNSFSSELALIRANNQEHDWKRTSEFINKFANTNAAHDHFIDWLKSKVEKFGGSLQVRFKGEKLRELNDTEGIYACAMRALDSVEQEAGEKLVTLYLSPGTPVMSFVWAFAALGHPSIKKRLLTSSVIGNPPETVPLPAEWLELYGAKQKVRRDPSQGFDAIFHLFGEQRMPSLLGIRQFESKCHIFVNSKQYPASCMQSFINDGDFDELNVDPWNARAVREQILRRSEQLPDNARIGFNLTGGTKLMYAGALAAARALGAVPFYFNSSDRSMTFVDNFESMKIKSIDSVEDFLLLNGDDLKLTNQNKAPVWSEDRLLLTEMLWNRRYKMINCYAKLLKYNKRFIPFRIEGSGFVFSLDENKVAKVSGHGLKLRFEDWPDFAKYLCGCWLEEYLYLKLRPYEESGLIKDLRINVELGFVNEQSGGGRIGNIYNEMDVVFTDGYSLYIAECKAGNVTQEQIMKLQNQVRYYGGIGGRGLIACCVPPTTRAIRKKIDDANLSLCCGENFLDQLKALMEGIAVQAKLIENRK